MRKQLTVILLSALMLSGCASGRMGNPGAIVGGAAIGGSLGSSIGGLIGDNNRGWRGGYRGLKLRKIRFIDDNRNHAIDGGESSKIIFEIMNEGRNPVYDVVPIVETVGKVKHIGISPTVMIEEILPGEGIRYTATVYAGSKLKDGEVTFRVAVSDENGVICDSQEFTLPTQRAD